MCVRFPGFVEMLLAWRWQLLWSPAYSQLSGVHLFRLLHCFLGASWWRSTVVSVFRQGLFLCWRVRLWFPVSETWSSLSLKTCVCFQNEELSWGPDACPCVQGIQGSSLFPVNVARKITLLGKNFHLYQVASSTPSALRNCINAEHCLGNLSPGLLKMCVRHSCGSAYVYPACRNT